MSEYGSEFPKISVIIPFYNGSAFLDRLFGNISEQVSPPAEVILVNDGSSKDESRNLEDKVCAWSNRVCYSVTICVLEKNRGVSVARNAGWEASTGELVAFLDCDDTWHPNKLEQVGLAFKNNQILDVLGHRTIQVGSIDCIKYDELIGSDLRILNNYHWLVKNHYVTCSSVVVRKSLPYRFDESKRRSEDYALWLEACFSGRRTCIIDSVLGYYFKSPYGHSGLSGDVREMENSELNVYKGLLAKKHISFIGYLFCVSFSMIKYMRRLAILWHSGS